MCTIMKWISNPTNVHAESTGKASIRGFGTRFPPPVSLWGHNKCLCPSPAVEITRVTLSVAAFALSLCWGGKTVLEVVLGPCRKPCSCPAGLDSARCGRFVLSPVRLEPFCAGLAALPSVRRWLNLVSCICTAAFVPVPDSLGGPEPYHSPLLLQSSCAVLATVTYFKNSKPQISGHCLLFFIFFNYFFYLFFSFLSLFSLPFPSCPRPPLEGQRSRCWSCCSLCSWQPVLAGSESLPLALLASTAALQPAPVRVGAHCRVLCKLVLLKLI